MEIQRSGALNRRIEVWRKTSVKDEYGAYVETWALHIYIRAYVRNHYGHQGISRDEVFDSQRIRLSARNQSDITVTDRVKIYGEMYTIEFIQPDYSSRWITIHCNRIND